MIFASCSSLSPPDKALSLAVLTGEARLTDPTKPREPCRTQKSNNTAGRCAELDHAGTEQRRSIRCPRVLIKSARHASCNGLPSLVTAMAATSSRRRGRGQPVCNIAVSAVCLGRLSLRWPSTAGVLGLSGAAFANEWIFIFSGGPICRPRLCRRSSPATATRSGSPETLVILTWNPAVYTAE